MTTGRRSSPVLQLQCTGGSAQSEYSLKPKVVQCKNVGFDGVDVQWECTANLDTTVQLGKLDVSCEGYNHPDDPYILAGSCGLSYELEYTNPSKKSAFYQNQNNESGSIFGWVVLCGFILFFVYILTRPSPAGTYQGAQPYGSGGNGYPPQPPYGPGNYDPNYGAGPGTGAYPNLYPQYPQYPQAGCVPPPQQQGWRPGFWSGAGLGYLFGRNTGYNNHYYQSRPYVPTPTPHYTQPTSSSYSSSRPSVHYVRQYYIENDIKSYRFINLPISYFFPPVQLVLPEGTRQKRTVDFRYRLKYHLERGYNEIEKILEITESDIETIYLNCTDIETFKFFLKVYQQDFSTYLFQNPTLLFKSPCHDILKFVVIEYSQLLEKHAEFQIAKSLDPNFPIEYLYQNLTCIHSNFHMHYDFLGLSAHSDTSQNMDFLYDSIYNEDKLRYQVAGKLLQNLLISGRVELFEMALEKQYIPSGYKFHEFDIQPLPVNITTKFTLQHFHLLKRFHELFQYPYQPIYSISSILSCNTSEPIEYVYKNFPSMDSNYLFSCFTKTSSSASYLFFMEKGIKKKLQLEYFLYPYIANDLQCVKATPLEYLTNCRSLINVTNLNVIQHVMQKTSTVLNDLDIMLPMFGGQMSILRYLWEFTRTRVKFGAHSLYYAIKGNQFEMVKFLVEKGIKLQFNALALLLVSGNEEILEYLYKYDRLQFLSELGNLLKYTFNVPGLFHIKSFFFLAKVGQGDMVSHVSYYESKYFGNCNILEYYLTHSHLPSVLMPSRKNILLERSVKSGDFKLLKLINEHRDNPKLIYHNRFRSQISQVIILKLKNFKMILYLFQHNHLKMKHLSIMVKYCEFYKDFKIIRYLIEMYKDDPIKQHQIFYQSIRISILQNYEYMNIATSTKNSLLNFYQMDMKFNVNSELVTKSTSKTFLKKQLFPHLKTEFTRSITPNLKEYIENQQILKICFK
ncbi:hypothetical protein DLAC_08219 [Tieghemostelium lacteum]|uniref:Store-operated calcium entry-associated regulatory factor n=1 Tax=Tieghemostelium lacteum TaxID=361077 RepID=A0A151ZBF5_TIELA|nr:hypothetical protein DLAC_08219 [Tieghemostelium lacteum]|eukprot:KYQ91280.1 hypothetical protein DLAC_08219 [Tieghemostelium lacteum]